MFCLANHNDPPISMVPPTEFLEDEMERSIPHIGELMLACFLKTEDITDWYVNKKILCRKIKNQDQKKFWRKIWAGFQIWGWRYPHSKLVAHVCVLGPPRPRKLSSRPDVKTSAASFRAQCLLAFYEVYPNFNLIFK